MSIIAVGCSHSSASLAVLEPLGVPASEVAAVLAQLQRVATEALVLSTCNRTEVYALVDHPTSDADRIVQVLADRARMRADELRAELYVHQDAAAVRHALRVASGLESMVLGEDQIQAQWKRALGHARAAATLGPVLDRLGAAALSCGKRVRTVTEIGRHSVSLESLAVRAVSHRLGALKGRDVLLIGTGESAALIARHLRGAHEARLTVASRSFEKAQTFANHIGARPVRVEDLPHVLAHADSVFCCTSAPHAVLAAEHLTERVATRPGDPLVCVDLGMPRDIDDSVATVAGAQVISLTELAALAEQHREQRRRHIPAAASIVDAEAARFLEWRTARGSAATMARLRAHAEALGATEHGTPRSHLEQAAS